MTATSRNVTEEYTTALTIDLQARTVTVGSWGTVPILGDADGDTVAFMKDKNDKNSIAEVSTGTVNRITGAVSVQIITYADGLYRFYGRCQPAQRMF
jgi:hypothetical protein